MTFVWKVLCGTGMAILFLGWAIAQTSTELLPFQAGEKLSYRISWSNILEAGGADLSVSPGNPKSVGIFRFELRATTATATAASYPFTDEFVSHFDTSMGAPTLFEKNFKERSRIVKERVAFDQLNHWATFTNSKNQSKRIPIELGTQDPISALYSIRSLGLKPGMLVVFPVQDGSKTYQLEGKVVGLELISTKLGNFKTHRVEFILRSDGSLLSDKKITLWLTTDSKKIPVLATVALPIGAAVIELSAQS